MIVTCLQYFVIFCLTTLGSSNSFEKFLVDREAHLLPVRRNLDYSRPAGAILFNTDIADGVAVNIDFDDAAVQANNIQGTSSMLLEISSTRSTLCYLDDDHSLFIHYTCPPNADCITQPVRFRQASEAFWSFKYYEMAASFKISGSDWNSNSGVYYITSYSDMTYLGGTKQTYGWIGLAASTAVNYPSGNPLFSLYIEDVNSGAGWILFDVDLDFVDPTKLLATIGTGLAWEMNGFNLTVNGQQGPLESLTAIFDLQYGKTTKSSMAVPPDTFNFLISALAQVAGMVCTTDSCTYTLSPIDNAPPIVFRDMLIPASVYMTNQNDGTYKTNFIIYNTDWDINYYNNPGDSNMLIFGWMVLSKYYFVFQSIDNQASTFINLYARPDGTSPTPLPPVVIPPADNTTDSTTNPDNTTNADNTTNTDDTPATNDASTGNDTSTSNNTSPGNDTSANNSSSTTPISDVPTDGNDGNNNSTNSTSDDKTQIPTDDSGSSKEAITDSGTTNPDGNSGMSNQTLSVILCVVSMIIIGLIIYFVNKSRSINSEEDNLESQLSSEMTTVINNRNNKTVIRDSVGKDVTL